MSDIPQEGTLDWMLKQSDEKLVEILYSAGRIPWQEQAYWLKLMPLLRKAPPPEVDALPVPLEQLKWLARQKLENDQGHDAYVAMEAVSLAQSRLFEAGIEWRDLPQGDR